MMRARRVALAEHCMKTTDFYFLAVGALDGAASSASQATAEGRPDRPRWLTAESGQPGDVVVVKPVAWTYAPTALPPLAPDSCGRR